LRPELGPQSQFVGNATAMRSPRRIADGVTRQIAMAIPAFADSKAPARWVRKRLEM
jgi:hypothetical protein